MVQHVVQPGRKWYNTVLPCCTTLHLYLYHSASLCTTLRYDVPLCSILYHSVQLCTHIIKSCTMLIHLLPLSTMFYHSRISFDLSLYISDILVNMFICSDILLLTRYGNQFLCWIYTTCMYYYINTMTRY